MRIRSFVAAIAVVSLLVLAQAAFGGAFLALGKACKAIADGCLEYPGASLAIGLIALASTLYVCKVIISAVRRRRR